MQRIKKFETTGEQWQGNYLLNQHPCIAEQQKRSCEPKVTKLRVTLRLIMIMHCDIVVPTFH